MTGARLSYPSKTATQSGLAKTKKWLVDFPEHNAYIEPLMGWTGTEGTLYQTKVWFDTKEDAIAYLHRNNIPFEISEPSPEIPNKPKRYGEHFKAGRVLK